jgi:hypothetical protein
LKQPPFSVHSRKSCWYTFLAVICLGSLLGCGAIAGKQQGQQPPGQLTAAPSSLSFGNVQTGTSQSLNDTVTNTGQSSLTVSQITVTGTGFSITGISAPLTLGAGQSASFTVQFAPSSTGAASGNIAFATSNGTVNLPLSGTGVAAGTLTVNPTSVSFGTVGIGNAASQTVTLSNSGGQSLTITAAAVTGAGFSASGLTLPLTLGPSQSSNFSVSFAPNVTGAVTGNVALMVTGQSEVDIALSGTGVAPANLVPNPTSLTFTNVVVGTSSTQSETITNNGGVSAQITAVTASGTGFSVSGITLPATVGAGQSVSFNVTFAPQSTGSFSGNVAVTSNAQNSTLNIPLTGTAVAAGNLTASPTSISFGSVVVGTTASQTETLKNTGGSNVTVTAASISGAGMGYSGLTLPLTLTPNQSSTFTVTFTPASAGAVSGTMSLTVSGSANIGIPLSGTGVTPATLTANPTSLTFTNVLVGTSSTQSETIKNTGGASAQITAVTPSGTGFNVSGITLPVTVGSGQSVSFNVTFAPQTAGSFSGNVAVVSNAQNSTLNIPLAGTAVTGGNLTASPTSISFGNVILGDATSQIETLQNTGGSNVTVTAASISGAGMSYAGLTLPLTLTPNQSTTFSITFAPTAAGAVNGTMSLTVSGASNVGVPLSGTGITPATLTASPTSMTFSNVQVGQSSSQTETVKNTGQAAAHISAVAASGTGFSYSGINPPVTLNGGQSVSFTVTFTPPSAGSYSGNVTVSSDAQNPTLTVGLTGTAVGATGTLSVSSPINVGNVVVGTSGTASGTLSASGANVVVSGVSLSGANASEFAISGLTFPVTVTVGTPVSFTVTFTPTATGSATATASFASNASNSPTSTTLNGNGTPPPVHTVGLTWVASPTQGVTGYNVYRAVYSGNACGSYSNIGSTSASVTTFTDNNVTDGTTYCYATTAVDPSGESPYSNIAQAQIPPP